MFSYLFIVFLLLVVPFNCRAEIVFYLCSQIYAISKMNILIVFIVALRGRGRGRGLVAAADVHRRWQPRLRCSSGGPGTSSSSS